jgi:hypothetical protein
MLVSIIFSFICSVFVSIILTYFVENKGQAPKNSLAYFFGILLFCTLTLTFFFHPVGPSVGNLPLISLIGLVAVISLLVAEVKQQHNHHRPMMANIRHEDDRSEAAIQKEFSIIFWIIVVGLVSAITYAVFFMPKVLF